MAEKVAAGAWDALNEFGVYGQVMIRLHRMREAGEVHDGHRHHIDHVSAIVQGAVRIRWRQFNDAGELVAHGSRDFKAPTFCTISKDKWHEVTALEPDTVWLCIFSVPADYLGDRTQLTLERHDTYAEIGAEASA